MLEQNTVRVRSVENTKNEHGRGDENVIEGERGGLVDERRAGSSVPCVQER